MMETIKTKVLSSENLSYWVAYNRFHEKKIVFSNGCFDILHLGHVDYLMKAKDLGDVLIVGLNSDESTRKLKGENRPINTQDSRAVMLASLQIVDAVIIFNEETPYELIKQVKPDVLVKGSDYQIEEIAGYDIVQANEGQVVTIDLLPGYSTTVLIDRIKDIE
ncbi:D-glycero-beta-D-manno-heptose 1-phosphate adenylyltransferase [candidate division KSB1 bacterium]